MLKKDVLEAVKEGKFFIYAISKADEGLEIMTGMRSVNSGKTGHIPKALLITSL